MKGILFTEAMFHATIEGRKTQTRRLLKPQPETNCQYPISIHPNERGDRVWTLKVPPYIPCGYLGAKPRYKVGEILYIKEPYFEYDRDVYYKFDKWNSEDVIDFMIGKKWKNKLFMPEKYARYFIEITGVRCERLQEISDEDCLKEGIEKGIIDTGIFNYSSPHEKFMLYHTPQQSYAALFDKINGRGSWDANPFVWVYEYRLTNV